MSSSRLCRSRLSGGVAALAWLGMLVVAVPASASPIVTVSAACPGQNAEVEQAADRALGYVYEEWMGCGTGGIGFARSTDGGRTFDAPFALPGTEGAAWDPTLTVAPNGTVYAVFMRFKADTTYPVLDASHDHGRTFTQVSALIPPQRNNWGDRPFVAVAPDGTVYVTWDYGPESKSVTYICTPGGSCAFATGDLNVVVQKSSDGGRTWSPITPVSPGFPASGGDSAPLVIEPDGRIDVLYQGYRVTNPKTYALAPAFSYFTSSTDHGATWSAPIAVGAQGGTMSLAEWWIDGAIAIDAGGDLYATWDTQGRNTGGGDNDVGWLSYSTDHGATWSAPIQAPADRKPVPHIIEPAGGAPGIAYVGWLSDSNPQGYAQYLRTFSIERGWLTQPIRVSREFGDPAIWPGDTFGISTLSPRAVVLSWGSAPPGNDKQSEIFARRLATGLP
jgi:hypothetical protein